MSNKTGKRWIAAFAAAGLAAVATGMHGAEPADSHTVYENVIYARPGGEPLPADVYVPSGEGPFPAVLCIHGGAWRFGDKGRMKGIARQLAKSGYTAVAINYRLAPKYRFPAQLEDCRAAMAWMRQNADRYHIDPKRIGVYGYSAGGHLAALLGVTVPSDTEKAGGGPKGKAGTDADLRPRAVVAGGAPCDFRDVPADERWFVYFLGGTRREKPDVYRRASPAAFVSSDDPPIFFYNGQDDFLVPVAGPRKMAEQLKRVGVETEMYVVTDEGHIRAFLDQEARHKAIEFLDKHLKK